MDESRRKQFATVERRITAGWLAALVYGIFKITGYLWAVVLVPGVASGVLGIVYDVGVLVFCILGLYQSRRDAAIVLVLYFASNVLFNWWQRGLVIGDVVWIGVFGYFFASALDATFEYAELSQDAPI